MSFFREHPSAPEVHTQANPSEEKVKVMSRDEAALRSAAFALALAISTLAALLLNGCELRKPSPQPTRETDRIKPEPNFAFTFERYECYTYRLDTFDNNAGTPRIQEAPAAWRLCLGHLNIRRHEVCL